MTIKLRLAPLHGIRWERPCTRNTTGRGWQSPGAGSGKWVRDGTLRPRLTGVHAGKGRRISEVPWLVGTDNTGGRAERKSDYSGLSAWGVSAVDKAIITVIRPCPSARMLVQFGSAHCRISYALLYASRTAEVRTSSFPRRYCASRSTGVGTSPFPASGTPGLPEVISALLHVPGLYQPPA